MSEYLYVPDDDSEYGPVWLASEAREHFSVEELSEAKPAEEISSRGGHFGHYLAAEFLNDAADLVGDSDAAAEWRRAAAAYNLHGGGSYCPEEVSDNHLVSGVRKAWRCVEDYTIFTDAEQLAIEVLLSGDPESHLCKDCEFIHEAADAAESVLSDLGYVTVWNDGYTIYKIEE